MYGKMKQDLTLLLQEINDAGLYKRERIIGSPQGVEITLQDGRRVLNFCANNYLGLASHPELIKAAHNALDRWGYGLSSVRFICGTQSIHREMEQKMAEFLGMDDAILYVACFDANGGVFEPLLGEDSAIITDRLNHASIIDGVRLCKAHRQIYRHGDLADLEERLRNTRHLKYRLIVTDGAFSMDGAIAPLPAICELAERYDALLLVDDSHATGFIGPRGRGTHEYHNVMDRVDIITTTFGKALGGANGGCVAAHQEIIDLLRQRSRPYLFSNTVAPMVAAATLRALELLEESTELRDRLAANTAYFRQHMMAAGFDLKPGEHPICPIMLGKHQNDARLSQDFANALLDHGIYVIGFYYPVVPKGQSRIRVQISAAHTQAHLDRAIEAFTTVGRRLGIIA